MDKYKFLRLHLFLLAAISICSNFSPISCQPVRKQVLKRIDFESIVNKEIGLKLSEIVDEIKYIPLETNGECLLGDVDPIRIYGNQIFLISNNQVYKFNKAGKFLGKIGSLGKGPGEYLSAYDIQINEYDEQIYVLDTNGKKIHMYSINGLYLESFALGPGLPWQMLFFNHSILVFNQAVAPIPVQLFRVDLKGNVIFNYPTMSGLINSSIFSTEASDYASFKMETNSFNYTSAWTDTVYRIINNNWTEALFCIDYGKYKYPLKGKFEGHSMTLKPEFVYQTWKVITNRYLFFYYGYHWKNYLAVYDIKSNSFILNKMVNKLLPGIINDIDGGIDISRIHSYLSNNGSELISAIQALDFTQQKNNDESNNLNPIFLPQRKAFKELVQNLNEDDNPVIQIIHLK